MDKINYVKKYTLLSYRISPSLMSSAATISNSPRIRSGPLAFKILSNLRFTSFFFQQTFKLFWRAIEARIPWCHCGAVHPPMRTKTPNTTKQNVPLCIGPRALELQVFHLKMGSVVFYSSCRQLASCFGSICAAVHYCL
jgi:hypothetical protein